MKLELLSYFMDEKLKNKELSDLPKVMNLKVAIYPPGN